MERAGSQLKRPKVWQIPAFPRYDSTDMLSKSGFEKRRLSLRSKNTTISDATRTTTTTPQALFSISRLATGLTQKQPGKENESPFIPLDHPGKLRATVTNYNSTTKRKKLSNPIDYITNSEKNIIRRRLSGEYEDQLLSNKYYPANLNEPIAFSTKTVKPPQTDFKNRDVVATKFPVYDDTKDSTTSPLYSGLQSASPELKAMTADKESKKRILKNHPPAIPQNLYFLWNSYRNYESRKNNHEAQMSVSTEEKVKIDESSASHDQENSGAEFPIERVDCKDGRPPGMSSYRKVKSASDIGRLNVPLRRGDDISPLKRRINQLKRSGRIVGKSFGIDKKRAKTVAVARAVSKGEDDVSNSKVESKRIGVIKKLTGPISEPCSGQTSEQKYVSRKSSTGAIKKINHCISTEMWSDTKISFSSESRTIKSAAKVSRLFDEIPLEIQYATDYTEEAIELEYAREGYCYKISKAFLKGRVVTPGQRRIVVNFLISVHAYLLTSSSTLHQAIKMFDAILDIKDVSVTELQLVALGTLWIAIKNIETRIPTAGEMISFAKDMYLTEGPGLLCKCERKILKTLGFNIRFPDPFYISAYYLQRWSSLGTIPNESSTLKIIYHCTGYLLDIALLGENYSAMSSELLAAAATQTAAAVVLNVSRDSLWNNEKLTGYTQEEINRVADPLLQSVLDSAEKDSLISAVYKKYKTGSYDNTSDYLVLKIKRLPLLISGKQS